MKLYGQRWQYRLDNTVLVVDNAYAFPWQAQERMILNGDVVHETSGSFVFRRNFAEEWLTPKGETELAVKLQAKLFSVECTAMLHDHRLEPESCAFASWTGNLGDWPADNRWKER